MDQSPGKSVSCSAGDDADGKPLQRVPPVDAVEEAVQNFVDQTVTGDCHLQNKKSIFSISLRNGDYGFKAE